MYFDQQRDELVRLGYSIVSESEYETIGVRNVWHWDVFATNMTYVVYLRATGPLSRANIESEYGRMIEQARQLDPSRLPNGFQHGRTIVPVYMADSVNQDAVLLLESASPMRFAEQIFPMAFDRSTGRSHYLRGTRIWGAAYVPKLRFLAQRLLEPASAPEKEPVSAVGVAASAVMVLALLFSCAVMVVVFLLMGRTGTWQ